MLAGPTMATRRATKSASKERASSREASVMEIDDADRGRLAQIYSVALPDDLFTVWEIARSIRPSRPLAAFADALGLTLRGPFEHLAERSARAPRKEGLDSATTMMIPAGVRRSSAAKVTLRGPSRSSASR